MIGTLVSTYGLCATVFTAIRNQHFADGTVEENLAGFQLFQGVSTGVVSIVAAFGLYQIRYREREREKKEEKYQKQEKQKKRKSKTLNVPSLSLFFSFLIFRIYKKLY